MKKKILGLTVVLLLIGVNLYAAGDLVVKGQIAVGSDSSNTTITSLTSGRFTVLQEDPVNGPTITMKNYEGANPVVFEMKPDQTPGGHFDIIPGGRFSYWLFAESSASYNPALKVCGYPSGASSSECVSMKIDGANNDLNMTTEGTGSDILLMPQANVGIGTTSPTYPLEMASGAHVTSGGAWTNASSREYKENISKLSGDEAIKTLKGLDPVTFNYKADEEEKYVGFIAEEVPELVAMKDRKGLSPMDIVAVLTKVVQEQQRTIVELNEEMKEIKREMKLKGSMASVMN